VKFKLKLFAARASAALVDLFLGLVTFALEQQDVAALGLSASSGNRCRG
jgi:hypothetical protein